ncbi:MAG TPA: DUF929 family protein [Ktedonobacterales bacterium]
MANQKPSQTRQAAARAGARNVRSGKKKQSFLQRNWIMLSAIGVLVVALIALIVAASNSNPPSITGQIGQPAPANVLKALESPDAGLFNAVSGGGVAVALTKVANTPVQNGPNGKPQFLYIGGEYCPYCAADRWSYIMALSRFGTFKNLKLMASSDTDSFPTTATFSFAGSSFTSQYVDFVPVEASDRARKELEKLTDQESALMAKYNATPYVQSAGGIPFISIGNQFVRNGSGYDPSVINGQTWDQIAQKLTDSSDPVTKAVVGNANYLTAAICLTTNNQPGNVCTAAPIPNIEKILQQLPGK